jgi:hypothetical protein
MAFHPMTPKERTILQARLFVRLALLSFIGFAFYYAHLFLALRMDRVLFKSLAVLFLLATIPLPIIATNNRKLFPKMPSWVKLVVPILAAFLFFHHFLMTFIFVLFLNS